MRFRQHGRPPYVPRTVIFERAFLPDVPSPPDLPSVTVWTTCALVLASLLSLAATRRLGSATSLGDRAHRWTTNACLFVLGEALRSAIVVGARHSTPGNGAAGALATRFGPFLGIVLGVLALDFLGYGRHVLFHRSRLLWRIHRVHHSDDELDWSTAIRFHPFETVIAGLVDAAFVAWTGISPWAVVVHGLLLAVTGVFTHTNVRIPEPWNRIVGAVFVTPLRHRAHHHPMPERANGNFGVLVPWWDRMFGTCAPEADVDDPVGVDLGSRDRTARFGHALAAPFVAFGSPGEGGGGGRGDGSPIPQDRASRTATRAPN